MLPDFYVELDPTLVALILDSVPVDTDFAKESHICQMTGFANHFEDLRIGCFRIHWEAVVRHKYEMKHLQHWRDDVSQRHRPTSHGEEAVDVKFEAMQDRESAKVT
jgi:hypothetical protein